MFIILYVTLFLFTLKLWSWNKDLHVLWILVSYSQQSCLEKKCWQQFLIKAAFLLLSLYHSFTHCLRRVHTCSVSHRQRHAHTHTHTHRHKLIRRKNTNQSAVHTQIYNPHMPHLHTHTHTHHTQTQVITIILILLFYFLPITACSLAASMQMWWVMSRKSTEEGREREGGREEREGRSEEHTSELQSR